MLLPKRHKQINDAARYPVIFCTKSIIVLSYYRIIVYILFEASQRGKKGLQIQRESTREENALN